MGLIRSHISWRDFPMKINEKMRRDAPWKTGKLHSELKIAAHLIVWKVGSCLPSLPGLINGWHRQRRPQHLSGRHGRFSSTNVILLYLLQRVRGGWQNTLWESDATRSFRHNQAPRRRAQECGRTRIGVDQCLVYEPLKNRHHFLAAEPLEESKNPSRKCCKRLWARWWGGLLTGFSSMRAC